MPKLSRSTKAQRVRIANAVLAVMVDSTVILMNENGGYSIAFKAVDGTTKNLRWSVARAGTLGPGWADVWGKSATMSEALTMLMRWIQNKPVYGIRWWSDLVDQGLAKPYGNDLLETLKSAGYPTEHSCINCGLAMPDDNTVDWHFNRQKNIEGPGCASWQYCPNRLQNKTA